MNITQQDVEHSIVIATTAAYFLSHILAATGTPKWLPSWAVIVINLIAANYGKTKNKEDV